MRTRWPISAPISTFFGCAATDKWVYMLDFGGATEASYFTVVNFG